MVAPQVGFGICKACGFGICIHLWWISLKFNLSQKSTRLMFKQTSGFVYKVRLENVSEMQTRKRCNHVLCLMLAMAYYDPGQIYSFQMKVIFIWIDLSVARQYVFLVLNSQTSLWRNPSIVVFNNMVYSVCKQNVWPLFSWVWLWKSNYYEPVVRQKKIMILFLKDLRFCHSRNLPHNGSSKI